MTSKDDLRNEVDELKSETERKGIGILYEHPDTEALYDEYKERVDPDDYGLVIMQSWYMAPFVVDRDEAEANGWDIVTTVVTDDDYYTDLVEVSKWCINPWVDDPDKRKVSAND